MNQEAVRAAAQMFLDDDTPRLITGHQPVGPDGGGSPLPDYERILKVTIPVDPRRIDNGRTALTFDRDDDRLADLDTPIDPCGYFPHEELATDQTLQTWLFATPEINGPELTGSGRQLVNVDDPLLDDLIDMGIPPNRLDRLEPLLDAHERDPSAHGSHANTILDHRSRSAETQSSLNGQLALVRGTPDLDDVPSQSVVFQEVMGIVSERRAAPHLPERKALDELRRETAGPEYDLALDIIDWLRNGLSHRLSYVQISDLLDYCRYATCPDRMLAHMLADLAHGMPPEDIPYHSSYFDREYNPVSPIEQYGRRDQMPQEIIDHLAKKLFETTFETVRLEAGWTRLVKEWWCFDPPATVPPTILRTILLLRRLHAQAQNRGYSLVRSTTADGALGGGIRGELSFQYQDDNDPHPFREAMDTTDPPDVTRLDKRFRGTYDRRFDSAADAVNQVWRRTQRNWFDRQTHFDNTEDFADWVTGDAPTDASGREICQHYL